jgi:hypothetical protein
MPYGDSIHIDAVRLRSMVHLCLVERPTDEFEVRQDTDEETVVETRMRRRFDIEPWVN